MDRLLKAIFVMLALLAGTAVAAPTYQAAGTEQSGRGAVSPAWPTHAVGDIALLFVESTGGEAVTLSTAAGFVEVANSPQSTGTGTNGTRLTVFWARATSTNMATPTVADPGDHVYARILTYRGVIASGNPWDATGGGVKATASTSLTVAGVTTTVADTLVVQAAARDRDNSSAHFSNQTNANLSGIVERSDAGTTSGNGGGFAVWDGVMATTGATDNTTATLSRSLVNAFLTIALRAPLPVPIVEYRFDENAPGIVADSSGNALSGTLNGGVTVGGSGKVCSGYNFNGSNAFVSVPHNARLNLSAVSVAAWVRHSTSTFKAWEAILAKGDTTYRLHLYGGCVSNPPPVTTADGFDFGVNVGCSTADANSGTVPVIDQWYHVVGTYDGTAVTIYVDGALKISVPYAGSINSNTLALFIGANSEQAGRFWSGDIDEVKIFGTVLSAPQISAGYANENAGKNWDGTARTCAQTVDHFLIQHPGVGLTCSPQTVQVTACANPNCTSYVDGVGVTLQPGGATVTTSSTGAVNATVARTTAGTATLSATSSTATAGATQCTNTTTNVTNSTSACDMTFSTAGFVITAPNHTACTPAAVTIEAMQAGTANRCVPAYSNITQSVNLNLAYTNPSTGTISATVATGTIGTIASAHSLAFDGTGKATLSLTYPDVGLVALNAAGTAPNGVAMSGSGSFVVAPASLSLGATTPAAPIKAGNTFDVAVKGNTAVSAACPTAAETPNYGHETVPQLALVKSLKGPTTGGSDPALTASTFTVLTSGVSASQSWPEVGEITLQAQLLPDVATPAVSNYLGYVLGAEINSTVSDNIRFIPDHFDTAVVSAGGFPLDCPTTGLTCPTAYNGMVYSGQPFSVQVTAKNLTGGPTGTTTNYAGAYAKDVTLTAWGALGGTTNPGGGATPNGTWADGTVAASTFTAGVTTTAIPSYTFSTVLTAPTDIYVRATESSPGGDGVTSLLTTASSSVEGGVAVASGRIRISNAYGSEQLPLPVTATVQYYNAAGTWQTSTTDNATSFNPATQLVVVPVKGPLVAGNIGVTDVGAVTVAGGIRAFRINRPGVSGSADIRLSSPAYLLSVPGRVTFGVYKGANQFIYQREAY